MARSWTVCLGFSLAAAEWDSPAGEVYVWRWALGRKEVAFYSAIVRKRPTWVSWTLLPVQDLLSFLFWISGFFGNTIVWRGRRYYLHPDGRFELRA